MFGVPVTTATPSDLDRLIQDKVPEGRHLEYKLTVPVSPQRQKELRKTGAPPAEPPIDPAILSGTGIGDYGRNALLEELVAMANSDGGVIILGMEETKEAPPRAKMVCPLPHAIILERRLKDQIIDQIEPRLPYVAVTTILYGSEGFGVLLIETRASIHGPHWVRSTRLAAIRREDKCLPMSMLEIHDMVLRNGRRLDEVNQRIADLRSRFEKRFFEVGRELAVPLSPGRPTLGQWLATHEDYRMLGIQATIVPHQSLGLTRLEKLEPLISKGSVVATYPGIGQQKFTRFFFDAAYGETQILGGVQSELSNSERFALLRAERDGEVTTQLIWLWKSDRTLKPDLLLGMVGGALAVFDKLRTLGGALELPAEVDVEIKAYPEVATGVGEGIFVNEGRPLQSTTLFKSKTITDLDSINKFLNHLAGDFANAIGMQANCLPRYAFTHDQ